MFGCDLVKNLQCRTIKKLFSNNDIFENHNLNNKLKLLNFSPSVTKYRVN